LIHDLATPLQRDVYLLLESNSVDAEFGRAPAWLAAVGHRVTPARFAGATAVVVIPAGEAAFGGGVTARCATSRQRQVNGQEKRQLANLLLVAGARSARRCPVEFGVRMEVVIAA
jgi:hypothetical protein